jgi:hypothetical protein
MSDERNRRPLGVRGRRKRNSDCRSFLRRIAEHVERSPAACSFSALMICSSVNLLLRICPSHYHETADKHLCLRIGTLIDRPICHHNAGFLTLHSTAKRGAKPAQFISNDRMLRFTLRRLATIFAFRSKAAVPSKTGFISLRTVRHCVYATHRPPTICIPDPA